MGAHGGDFLPQVPQFHSGVGNAAPRQGVTGAVVTSLEEAAEHAAPVLRKFKFGENAKLYGPPADLFQRTNHKA